MKKVGIRDFKIGDEETLVVMSGPCVIESEDHTLQVAEQLKNVFEARPHCQLIFKASYDKANRSSLNSFRGPGLDEGLRILERVKTELDLPVVTDVHSPQEAIAAGGVCDVIQIPAFLCRQTDLIAAAGETDAAISVKKGQFMAPWDMENVVNKLQAVGCNKIILTERGATFGYNNLVSDMRAIPAMQQFGFPVCYDATHSVQLPGGQGKTSGGQREYIPVLAKAAIAAGANCLFMEAHPNPSQAKSDAASVLDIQDLPHLLAQLERLYRVIRE